MWRHRASFFQQSLAMVDVAMTAAAFLLAIWLRALLPRIDDQFSSAVFGALVPAEALAPIPRGDHLWLLLGMLPVWAVLFQALGTGRAASRWELLGRYARAVAFGIGLLIVVTFLFKLGFVSRVFVVMFAVLQLPMLVFGHGLGLSVLRIIDRQATEQHRVILVGSGLRALEFARNLQRTSPISVKIAGYISIPGEQPAPEARPRLGFVGSLDRVLDRLPTDEVVFAVEGNHPELFKQAVAACDARGVGVVMALPPQVSPRAKMDLASVSGFDLPLLGLRRTPTSQTQLAVKRLIDVLGGLLGFLLAAPVMLLATLAIKLDSPGPVLFRQVRVGRNGRRFVMLKFRSMVTDAEAKRAALAHLNEMQGPVFKIQRDPRITRVGRLLRKTSIDELPQLLNVLAGDMSLVGPRPPLPTEVEEYEPWQRRRLSVKPGLTGLWQVSGRNQVDFEEWMQLDLKYIDTWSLWLDLKIIARTIPTVLFHRGAS